MFRRVVPGYLLLILVFLTVLVAQVRACSLCGGGLLKSPSLREEASRPEAQVIFVGAAVESRRGTGGTGETVFKVVAVLRSHPLIDKKETVVLSRFIPIADRKNPPRYLLFCDVFRGKLDSYRGVPMKTGALADYLRQVMALKSKNVRDNLGFYFKYLEHPDPEVAQDAFLEFAKARDGEIGQAARTFSPARLRRWIQDPAIPPLRVSVYALLLGACGNEEDARLLRSKLADQSEHYRQALDGLLAGYISLRPRQGWQLAIDMLQDSTVPLTVRLAIERTLRLYHNWQPRASRPQLLKASLAMLAQGDLGDLATENLRIWEMWELTDQVIARYDKEKYQAPVKKRAIIRYALSCKPTPAVRSFLAGRRRDEPEVVHDIEEFLRLESKKE
jgi:hypothetical protein